MKPIKSQPTKTVLEWTKLDLITVDKLLGRFSSIWLFFTWLFFSVANMFIKPASPQKLRNKKESWKPPGLRDIESNKDDFSVRLPCHSFNPLQRQHFQELSKLSITDSSHPGQIRELERKNRSKSLLIGYDPVLNCPVYRHRLLSDYSTARDFV